MIKVILIALFAVFVGIQFIPVERTNPPVVREPQWDSPRTRELAVRACYDCHSNETVYPWYSMIAPISLLIAHDVKEGREELNFSEPPWGETHEAAEEVEEGEMPLAIYLPLHPEAKLSDAEKQELIDGLHATFGKSSGDHDSEDEDESHTHD